MVQNYFYHNFDEVDFCIAFDYFPQILDQYIWLLRVTGVLSMPQNKPLAI